MYLGNYYFSTNTVDTVYSTNNSSVCEQYIQPIIMEEGNRIDQPTAYYCAGESVNINGVPYFTDTTLMVIGNDCDTLVQQVRGLDKTLLAIDTAHVGPIFLYGYFYTSDTTITHIIPYENHPCDSLVITINIDILSSSTSEVLEGKSVRIFPNPTTGKTTITWQQGRATITLFSALGQPILRKKGEKRLDLELSHTGGLGLEAGVYFVKIEMERGGVAWRKVEVLR